jgi:hypothetical protein
MKGEVGLETSLGTHFELGEHFGNFMGTDKKQKKSLPPHAPAHTPKKTERKILSLLIGSMKFLF